MSLLTISIPAHNKSYLLEEAINSILNEPEFSKEVNIAISDNSLNNDINDLYKKKFAKNKSIKFHHSKEFKCLDSNVNRAVEIASGEYVWIFGDDDIIVSGVLKKLLTFLKKVKPNLVILNSKSFKGNKIIEESRRPHKERLIYCKNDNDIFLEDMAGYLTYIGGICVKKELWLKYFDKSKIGTFFAHIKCLADLKIGKEVHYFPLPAIKMRLGNQTWTNKSFLIWHKFYPEIIWGLKQYSKNTKEKIINRYPLNSFKTMIASRAYGRMKINEYKKYILYSKRINLKNKILIYFILLVNKRIITNIYKIYILIFKKKHTNNFSPKLALFHLSQK